jgi:crotonobetainyl-CoA:carnitine CoA-transferase CaiB-like acyl-CoA transferase
MDGCFATPPYHLNRTSRFLHHIKRLALSKRHSGYDLVFQAMSGLMSVTGVPDGEPGAGAQRAGYPVSDMTAGFYATIGVLAALHHRDTVSGAGQYIDLALLDAQVATMSSMSMNYLVAGQLPQRVGMRSQVTCPYQDFDCADGQVMIAVGNDSQFAQLCKVLGRAELAEDAKFKTTPLRVTNRELLVPIIAGIMRGQTIAYWMPRLREANVPSGPIYNFKQVFDDPQIRHRQVVREIPHPLSGSLSVIANPLKFSATPVEYNRPPPLLGEHSAEILRDLLGIDDAEIASLGAQGVIK